MVRGSTWIGLNWDKKQTFSIESESNAPRYWKCKQTLRNKSIVQIKNGSFKNCCTEQKKTVFDQVDDKNAGDAGN